MLLISVGNSATATQRFYMFIKVFCDERQNKGLFMVIHDLYSTYITLCFAFQLSLSCNLRPRGKSFNNSACSSSLKCFCHIQLLKDSQSSSGMGGRGRGRDCFYRWLWLTVSFGVREVATL